MTYEVAFRWLNKIKEVTGQKCVIGYPTEDGGAWSVIVYGRPNKTLHTAKDAKRFVRDREIIPGGSENGSGS